MTTAREEEERMLEKEIEKILVKEVKRLGGRAYKWVSPGTDGVPDRIVLLPGGIIWFAELKADNGRVSPRQEYQLAFLKRLGFNTIVIRGENEVREFVAAREKEVGVREI